MPNKYTILIVDDLEGQRTSIGNICDLVTNNNCDLLLAETVEQAKEILDSQHESINLAIVDYKLDRDSQNVHGILLVAYITCRYPNIQQILITAHDVKAPGYADEAKSCGAVEYLTKNDVSSPDYLAASIERLLKI